MADWKTALSISPFTATLLVSSCVASCAPSPDPSVNERTGRRAALPVAEQTFSTSVMRAPEVLNTGDPVDADQYSWQVALRFQHAGQTWRCGGTLITRDYILTAAHCVDVAPAESRRVTRIGLGSIQVYHGANEFAAGAELPLDMSVAVAIHPGWKGSGRPYAWDAALIRLAAPAATATPAPVRTVAFGEGWAVTSGWGNFDEADVPSDVLRAVRVPVVTNQVCRQALAAVDASRPGSRTSNFDDASTLCAISRVDDACVSDSGGPLVAGSRAQPQTIGIVSWGPEVRCGVPGPTGLLIGVYSRTSALRQWIVETTGNSNAVTMSPLAPTFEVTALADR